MALVLFIATFPLHSKLFPLPFTILGGEKIKKKTQLIGSPDRKSLKKDFLGVTCRPLQEKLREKISNAESTCVRGGYCEEAKRQAQHH